VLRLTVSTVSIVPSGDSNGRCRSPGDYHCRTQRDRRQTGRAIVIGCFAGLEAERLFDPDAPEHHASDDFALAFRQSVRWGFLPPSVRMEGDEAHLAYLRRLRAEARRLVDERLGVGWRKGA